MNFLNGIRIVRTQVSLLLLHIQVHLLLASLSLLPLALWVLDSGVIDYITGNQPFFSSLSTMGYLPLITMVNGFRVPSHGVDTINLFPSLSINNVLYVLS